MSLAPHFIGADSGSTDPGPHYLGSGDTLFADSAYQRDLRLMLLAGRAAKVPVIVGSACTSGSDAQLKRLVGIARTYHLTPEVVSVINYDTANAIKITIPRPVTSGDIDDTDVFGGQQHGPLVEVDVP